MKTSIVNANEAEERERERERDAPAFQAPGCSDVKS